MSNDSDETRYLIGWPFSAFGVPTATEEASIRSAHHELSLHEPGLGDERHWYIAGQIVARLRRDGKRILGRPA